MASPLVSGLPSMNEPGHKTDRQKQQQPNAERDVRPQPQFRVVGAKQESQAHA
ncbi:hypothetical protein [Pinirhizobacter soli]|uniref:hypothetical protein n=1 Tax=Pinirhizobacter soli TaxID=2786953 RepID=UPI00202A12DB|nr:hypothetical protein [Pinirhizobacter soli]